ncbi:hypothetical protein [Acinetobacter gerneri]|uniref:hypothetical protein n=1 Tax=Acinetobacter gerneri TaxID=202952 RepID=UPI0032136601
MKKIIQTICLFCILSSAVYANSSFSSTRIKSLIVHDYGGIYVVLESNVVPASEGCNAQKLLVLRKTHYLFKEMYAALLAAFHHKTPITGYVNGCYNTNDVTSIPVLTRLDSNN